MSEYHRLRLTRFDFDAGDFLSSPDVASMTATEIGQYVLLLCAAWLSGKDATLPNDPKVLAKLARAPRGVSPKVFAKFKVCSGDTNLIYNPRLSQEWDAALDRAQRRHEKAQKAAESRWNEDALGMPGECPEHSSSNAQPMLKNTSDSVPVSVPEIREKSKPSCPPAADEVSGDVSQSPPIDPEVSPAGMKLACLLRQRILANNSRARITEKQVVAWGRQADLMIRVDNRTVEEISALIEWSQRDPFWRGNILSMRKLREQFDQLTVKSRVKQEHGEPAWKRGEREAEKKQVEAVHTIFELTKKAGK
jgi:uncharacterized protein YdaU (DUF1376 family)